MAIEHNHPLFQGGTIGMMSGERPKFGAQVTATHENLLRTLKAMGLKHEATHGRRDEPERSVIIHKPTVEQMQTLGKLFGQESVIHSQGGQHKLIYTNGPHNGKYRTTVPGQHPYSIQQDPPENNYTHVPGAGYANINFDYSTETPPYNVASGGLVEQAAPAQGHVPVFKHLKLIKVFTPEEKGVLGDQLMESGFKPDANPAKMAIPKNYTGVPPKNLGILKEHPNAYEWHDPHTGHYDEKWKAQALQAARAIPGNVQNPEMYPVRKNDQAARVGAPNYAQFAMPYGTVTPGQSTNLLHYPYQGKLNDINKLVSKHGYKVHYAGGKYGAPDLANKNFNTGHLMVYDPSAASGGDFGHEEYTKGWRQMHELAHALTYPEVNQIYGEGRRIGKLGTHRTPNEAARSVHWEWLAAHKQRELSKQIGIHVPDETFNKELNTIMHDAVHRAVHGKFTEPSQEGFNPHAHKVPLQTALDMVRSEADKMGIKSPHSLAARQPAPAQPQPLAQSERSPLLKRSRKNK